METKLGQEQAFPMEQHDANGLYEIHHGMSKRYLTAKDFLCGMLSNMEFLKENARVADSNGIDADTFLVKTAYVLADELLKQENK